MKVSYAGMGLMSDEMANSFKKPKPTSLSEMFEHITKTYDLLDITELNLSCNNITVCGLEQILNFIKDNMPNLKILDLSCCRLYYDEWGTVEYLTTVYLSKSSNELGTVEALNKFLNETSLDKIIIMETPLAEYYQNNLLTFLNDFNNSKKIIIALNI